MEISYAAKITLYGIVLVSITTLENTGTQILNLKEIAKTQNFVSLLA